MSPSTYRNPVRLRAWFCEGSLWHLALDSSNTGVWSWDRQTDELICSRNGHALLGYAEGEVGNCRADWLALIFPEDLPKVLDAIDSHLVGNAPCYEAEFRMRAKNGEWRWMLSRGRVVSWTLSAPRAPVRVIGTHTDITRLKCTERSLGEVHADLVRALRFNEALLTAMPLPVFYKDREGRYLGCNRAFTELTGVSGDALVGRTVQEVWPGELAAEYHRRDMDLLADPRHQTYESVVKGMDGRDRPVIFSKDAFLDEHGAVAGIVGVCSDISVIKESQQRLEYQAQHDSLTGLPNRLMLGILAERVFDRARRENATLALLLLDLDRFKDVNDSHGHAAGDELLEQVAARLVSRLRGADTISRLGGDEFTVLLESVRDPADAARVSQELVASLSEPYALSRNREAIVGASIGIAVFPEHGSTLEELLQHADTALYRAKEQGRGRFVFFTDELTRAVQAKVDLEGRLRRAIAGNELRLYFQPQAEMVSGRVVGAEALVRWERPGVGVVAPSDFIPVAEETGLIVAIGRWVLREACRQGKEWRDSGLPPITLAVNLSPRELRHGDLAAILVDTLAETGYSADGLELELTETAVMDWGDEQAEQLQRARALGVRIALDDFGTGYSSLGRLKRLPLDMLKIDKSFVDDIPESRNDMEIAATIIGMSKTLSLDVLAEGVETEEQFAFLKARGCQKYQGYYLSPPLPPDAFVELLFGVQANSSVSAR